MRSILLLILLLVARLSPAQAKPEWQTGVPNTPGFGVMGWKHLGAVTSLHPIANGVELRAGRAAIRLTALSDSVVRVRVAPGGVLPADFSWAVLPQKPGSPARAEFARAGVEERPAEVKVSLRQSPQAVELATSALRARVERSPLRIIFLDGAGNVLQQDARPMAFSGSAFRLWKSMPEDEHYFGLGDKAGPLDHRNQAFTMWNTDAFGWQESTDPLYKTIPFFVALRRGVAYGVFLDNTYRSSFDFGKAARDAYSFGAEGGPLDYYFFYGPDPKKVIAGFTALAGRTPLPPLWSLGYQQCRYSYYPEARVRQIAQTLRAKKIPADVIYLDIDYQDGNRPFTINRQYFPNFEGMVRDLGEQGFKIVAITDLHLKKEPGYKPYDEGLAGNHFVKNPDGSLYVGKVWPGDSVFPEFTLARSREWWGSLYKDLVGMGIRGFWNDMNEPAIFERADKTMPLDTVHRVDSDGDSGGASGGTLDHRAVHNVFGMENARATYEGLRRLRPDLRPFVLTRAAYAGAWRYAASWTGDNSSSWNHLRLTLPTLLSLGVSGYTLVGNDVGGYAGSPPPDVLTRWIELGAFTPMFRNHTEKGSADQEPWVHGPEHEAIRRHYIELRYRLLPYTYTLFEESTRDGLPVMRPLFLEYPKEEDLATNDREFLFGPDLLVAPQVSERLDSYTVILPPGQWYDYWSGRRVGGGQVKVKPALDELPIFARAGAILPQQPVVQNTREVPQGPLELRVYAPPASTAGAPSFAPDALNGAKGGNSPCQGDLYLDDGNTFAYTRGEYFRAHYTCARSPNGLSVSMEAPQGSYRPWWEKVEVKIFGLERRPSRVMLGQEELREWSFEPASSTLTLTFPYPRAETKIDVQE